MLCIPEALMYQTLWSSSAGTHAMFDSAFTPPMPTATCSPDFADSNMCWMLMHPDSKHAIPPPPQDVANVNQDSAENDPLPAALSEFGYQLLLYFLSCVSNICALLLRMSSQ